MGIILREVIGWGLLALGLYAFRLAFGYVDNRQVVEAGIVTTIGWVIFHAGLQFVRTAMLVRAMQRGDSPAAPKPSPLKTPASKLSTVQPSPTQPPAAQPSAAAQPARTPARR